LADASSAEPAMMAAVAAKTIIDLRTMIASSSLLQTGRALCWNRAA
jgi:hypothetical protein